MAEAHIHSNAFYKLQGALINICADSPFPCWLGGEDVDQALSYCQSCAEKKVAAGEAEYVDGGWGSQEEDSCCHCDSCGRLLCYSLTDVGAECEKQHFMDHPPASPPDPETAFHLLSLLEAKMHDPEVHRIIEGALQEASR